MREPAGQCHDEVTELARSFDDERQIQRREHGRRPIEPCRVLALAMRSRRNVRFSLIAGSAPVTYHLPEWATSPYGCSVRSLCRPSAAVYRIETGRWWLTASAIESRTAVSGAVGSPA